MFGSSTTVPISKDVIHAVRHAHSEYALFLENDRKQALVEEAKKKKEEEGLEAMRAQQRTSKRLHEQLAEQVRLETVQMVEQETARQLIDLLKPHRSCPQQSKDQRTICKVQRLHRLC